MCSSCFPTLPGLCPDTFYCENWANIMTNGTKLTQFPKISWNFREKWNINPTYHTYFFKAETWNTHTSFGLIATVIARPRQHCKTGSTPWNANVKISSRRENSILPQQSPSIFHMFSKIVPLLELWWVKITPTNHSHAQPLSIPNLADYFIWNVFM